WRARADDRGERGAGGLADAAQHRAGRRSGRAPGAPSVDRDGQARDHGGSAAPPDLRDLHRARCRLLPAVRPAPSRDSGLGGRDRRRGSPSRSTAPHHDGGGGGAAGDVRVSRGCGSSAVVTPVRLIVLPDAETLAETAATIIRDRVTAKPDLVMAVPAGRRPPPRYERLRGLPAPRPRGFARGPGVWGAEACPP